MMTTLYTSKKKLEPIIPAVGSTGQVDGSSMISALAVDYDSWPTGPQPHLTSHWQFIVWTFCHLITDAQLLVHTTVLGLNQFIGIYMQIYRYFLTYMYNVVTKMERHTEKDLHVQ